MSASFLRTTGIVILVLAVAIGLLPLYIGSIGSGWPEFNLAINDFQLLDVTTLPTGVTAASVTSAIWIVAAIGETLIVAAWLKGIDRSQRAMRLA